MSFISLKMDHLGFVVKGTPLKKLKKINIFPLNDLMLRWPIQRHSCIHYYVIH
jgi:hypothetical protein